VRANLGAKLLVADIVRAQRIAMHDQHRRSKQRHTDGVFEQLRTTELRPAWGSASHQEIAVASHQEHPNAAFRQAAKARAQQPRALVRLVVTDPGFKYIAQQKKMRRCCLAACRAEGLIKRLQKARGQSGFVITQMHVGRKERTVLALKDSGKRYPHQRCC
jgi:hypothetical protein